MSTNANRRVATIIAVSSITMLGAAYAAVPLYAAFCRATGFAGTPQRVETASSLRGQRQIQVSFDANVAPGLDWSFEPEVRSVTLRTGETATVFFKAHNRDARDVAAVATFNVSPDVAGAWFDKISCFCFSEQHLKAGETAEWPVVFFLDPKLEKDNSMNGVEQLTLSYTLFAALDANKPVALAPVSTKPRL
jgi:cytochrome c oxidase assembly protein subunit 11